MISIAKYCGEKACQYYLEWLKGWSREQCHHQTCCTLYLDPLLERLRILGVGCHVGKQNVGAFGYAGDVVVIT